MVHRVVQIKPNLVRSVPCVLKTYSRNSFTIACLGKNLGFGRDICD